MPHWKFTKESKLPNEVVDNRGHYWHYKPEISEEAKTCFVKVVIEEGGGHDFHRHPEMHEILYILKGKAEQWVVDEMKVLDVGDSVYIAEDVVHATFNAGDGPLEFLAYLGPVDGWEAGTIDESENPLYSKYRLK